MILCVCVCVCVFVELHITAQSGPVVLFRVIICQSRGSSQRRISVCLFFRLTDRASTMPSNIRRRHPPVRGENQNV